MPRGTWSAPLLLIVLLGGCFGARGDFRQETAGLPPDNVDVVVRFHASDVPALAQVEPFRLGTIETWPRPSVRTRGMSIRAQRRRAEKIAGRMGGTHFALLGNMPALPGQPPWSVGVMGEGSRMDSSRSWWVVLYVPPERWPYLPPHLRP